MIRTLAFMVSLAPAYATAQLSSFPIDKLPVKNVIPNLSYIPAKSFTSLSYIGKDTVLNYRARNSSVMGFYISKTEVTNREYRQFTQYVKDSIAHTLLHHFKEGDMLDWNQPIDWKDKALDPMMVPAEDRLYDRPDVDAGKLYYNIEWNGKQQTIPVYPDTLVWITDFSFSYNEPLAKKYFSSPEYDAFPVVGVNLKQAKAFCEWKTSRINEKLKARSDSRYSVQVRMPTNAEWESAAFDTKDSLAFVSNNRNYNCNFGPIMKDGLLSKDYKDDGYFYTGPVKSFEAGPYGLYDMKGNIAEWTTTPLEEIMDAEVREDKKETVFVAKGGGWNSSPFYIQTGVCQFFNSSEMHSYLGFRYVVYVVHK